MLNLIEIEKRAIISEEKYNELFLVLEKQAEDLGEDDKDVCFFVFSDKMIKVCNNVSAQSAKIVYKSGKIHNSALEEIEIKIDQQDIEKAIAMFSNLGAEVIIQSFQKRHNYLYNGVEIALKYSDHWGYHLEMEIMVNSMDEKEMAEKKILEVANELGVELMTDEQILAFTGKIENDYKKL
ncbi:MAG: CYTH domain-containing protein [Candidatus Buchananbacteria bacterium]